MQVSESLSAAARQVVSTAPSEILDVDLFDPINFGPVDQQVAETLVTLEAEQKIAHVDTVDEVRARFSAPGMLLIYHRNAAGKIPIAVQAALADAEVLRLQDLTSGKASAISKNANTAHLFSVIKTRDAKGGILKDFFAGVKPFLRDRYKHLERAVTFSPVHDFLRWIRDDLSHDFLNESGAARVFHRDLPLFKYLVGNAKTFEDFSSPQIVVDMWRMASFYLTAGEQGPRGFSALNQAAKAHFPLGGRLDRVIVRGDDSEHGLRRSGGVIASWEHPFAPEEIEANSRAYREGKPPESSFIGNLKTPHSSLSLKYLIPDVS